MRRRDENRAYTATNWIEHPTDHCRRHRCQMTAHGWSSQVAAVKVATRPVGVSPRVSPNNWLDG